MRVIVNGTLYTSARMGLCRPVKLEGQQEGHATYVGSPAHYVWVEAGEQTSWYRNANWAAGKQGVEVTGGALVTYETMMAEVQAAGYHFQGADGPAWWLHKP